MRIFALLLILVSVAASRRSRSVVLRGQPYHWCIHRTASLVAVMAFLAHCLGG